MELTEKPCELMTMNLGQCGVMGTAYGPWKISNWPVDHDMTFPFSGDSFIQTERSYDV